jgi:hypothetical protein
MEHKLIDIRDIRPTSDRLPDKPRVLYLPGRLRLSEIKDERIHCRIPGKRQYLLLPFLNINLSLMAARCYLPPEFLKIEFQDLRLLSSKVATDIHSTCVSSRTIRTFLNRDEFLDFLTPLLCSPFKGQSITVREIGKKPFSEPLLLATPEHLYFNYYQYAKNDPDIRYDLLHVLMQLWRTRRNYKVIVEHTVGRPIPFFRFYRGNTNKYSFGRGTTTLSTLLTWFQKYTVTYVKLCVPSPATPFSLLVFNRLDNGNFSLTFEH